MAKRKRKKKRDKAARSGGAEPSERDRPQADAARAGARSDGDSAASGADKRRHPGHPDSDSEKEKPPKSATRSFVETVLTVVILVLVLRFLLIEAFKIPSSSMEPTLIGHPYHGDRVLAWKPSTYIGTPSRWSVIVFVKHPDRDELVSGETSDRNFIKRLVGLPGERILIAGGDVFVQGKGDEDFTVVRKPASVQESVWNTVYDAARDRWPADGPVRWETDAGLARDAKTGTISGSAGARAWARFATNHYDGDGGAVTNLFLRPARLDLVCPHCGEEFETDISTARTRLKCPSPECGRWLDVLENDLVVDDAGIQECPRCKRYIGNMKKELASGRCPHCDRGFEERRLATALGVPGRYPSSRHWEEAVADIRVGMDVRAADPRGRALVEIGLGEDRWVAEVPLAGGKARITGPAWPEGIESDAPVAAFDAGVARRVSLAHVDQSVVLEVDGRAVISKPYDMSWTARAGGPKTNSVRVGIEDAEATLSGVKIERDLHYLARGSPNVMEFYAGAKRRWEAEPVRQHPGVAAFPGDGDAVRTRLEIGQAEFLMLGDNSPSSDDGRRWGYVAKRDLIGRAFVLFWPPNRVRWLR
jgi:signal peptidase I